MPKLSRETWEKRVRTLLETKLGKEITCDDLNKGYQWQRKYGMGWNNAATFMEDAFDSEQTASETVMWILRLWGKI